MNFRISALLITGVLFTLSFPTFSEAREGATLEQLTHQAAIHWVSMQQLETDLADKKPINVGFDIDDTLLYSSPAFFYGKSKFSPDSMNFLKNKIFWNELSSKGWDEFSIPKQSGRELIEMHLKHGDNIYFITGRPAPEGAKEDLTEIIQRDFAIPEEKLNKVIYAGTSQNAKVEYIKKNHITVFYGDSDSDILDARKAGATGIRVLRPLLSTNIPFPVNGSLGEEVVANSQY
ncbi:acid phosphatase AphA [Salmonella enterica subsp. diarizonae]|nr:acid phosphatase AphA [Salmonella enterica subsp. diarizonae]ECF5951512.1 acid phosphatase AphA [Salmonella enterica subsp. diarizonae]